jgi:putative methyltransferase (TIGR04325 family)
VSSVEKICPNFISALAECGEGYDDPDIAKVIAFRTAKWKGEIGEALLLDQITNAVFAVGIAGANLTERPLRVLDFGGGCGIHYFSARSVFTAPLKWAIVETLTMVEHAAPIGAGGNFEAYDGITQAASSLGRVDLVLASGAIQYTPDPMASLDALIAIGASYFVLARFPAWGGQTTIGIQSGWLAEHMKSIGRMPPNITNRVVKCPITFVQFSSVREKFQKAYSLVLAVPSPSADYQVLGKGILGTTWVFRRNLSN